MIHKVINQKVRTMLAKLVEIDTIRSRTPLELRASRILNLTPMRPSLHHLPHQLVIIITADKIPIFSHYFWLLSLLRTK